MSRSIQLVLLCVVTLSYIQLGRADCDVDTLSRAVLQVLLPIMNDIKYDVRSMRRELTSLNVSMNNINETVSHLSGDLEQHKNQTTSVLVDLQSSINKSHTEQVSIIHDELESVLTEKLTHIEDRLVNQLDDLDFKLVSVNTTSELMRGDLRSVKRELTSLNETVSHLSGDLEQHKNTTASVLADLQMLNSKLVSVHTSMIEELTSLETQLSATLDDCTVSVLADLQSSINKSHTEQLNLIHDGMELVMTDKLTHIEDRLVNQLDDLDSKLNTTSELMRVDLRSVKRELTSLMNDLSVDLDEHKTQTITILAEIQTLDSKVVSVNASMTEELTSLETRLRVNLSELDSSVNGCIHGLNPIASQLNPLNSKLVSVHTTTALMRGDLNQIEQDLSNLNTSVTENIRYVTNQLNAKLGELNSSVDARMNEQLNSIASQLNPLNSKLASMYTTTVTMSGDLNSIERDLSNLDTSITEDIRSAKNQLNGKLIELNSKLVSVDTTTISVRGDISSVKREMTSLNKSLNRICDKMEEHEDHMTTEIMELEEHLQRNFTNQLKHSYGYITTPPCVSTGGWRRAVYLDMTDPNTNCPEGWNMTDYSKRTCGRASDGRYTCDSVTFSVRGGEYSQVCGRIRAYQWGFTGGFSGYHYGYATTVDDAYFSGVAVMHGSPRQHIWSFVAGLAENYPGITGTFLCRCDSFYFGYTIPPFVGEDYFCESGYIYPGQWIPKEAYAFHSNDTLWDGRDCHSSSTCCSLHNPPYFTKTLNTPTTDDIELRMCVPYSSANVAVELVELYVK